MIMKKFIIIMWWLFLLNSFLWLNNAAFAGVPDTKSETLNDKCINMNSECLLNGTCHFSTYDCTEIRKESRNEGDETSVLTFFQDAVYWATLFIWTVVAAGIIVSWLLLVFSSANSTLKWRAMNWLKYSIIGGVVVTLSLVIIRLVQFLARGGGSN